MVLVSFLSCQNKDLYQGSKESTDPNNNSTSNADYSAPYIYDFSDEVKNAEAVITIKVNKDITASNLTASVPPLKYNKTWLMMLTQDDCKQAAYCRTWAKINGKPVSSSDSVNHKQLFYDYVHLVNNDLPPNIIAPQTSLGCTDGANNEVRFAFATTLYVDSDFMNKLIDVKKGYTKDNYRFHMKTTLTWNDVMDMMNYGIGISFHDVKALNVKDASDILKHYKVAQDSIVKRLKRGCKTLTVPNGNKTYITASLNFQDIQTIVNEGSSFRLYPFQVSTDLQKIEIKRMMPVIQIEDVKEWIKRNLLLPPMAREAISIGVHSTDNGWMDFLQWVNDNYGQKGDDSVWFPSQEEYYEYNYYRIHGTQKIEQVDSRTIRVTATLPSGDSFYYPSTTINISGIKSSDIVSISSNDATSGFSYADYDNGIMMNIDCRKHLVELATHYVEKYEKDKTNLSNKADAIYFVNLLKQSSIKESLLKRI